jgi:thiol-disulfide isomerase/thioredoxin
MKHLNLITLALLILLTAALQGKAQQFTLTGKIKGQPDAPVFLRYSDNTGKINTDSAFIENGNFVFKGNIDGPLMATLYVSSKSAKAQAGKYSNAVSFFLEPTSIKAEGEFANLPALKFSGSKSQTEYIIYRDLFKPTADEMDAIQQKWLAHNAEYIAIARVDKNDDKLIPLGRTMDSLNAFLVDNNEKHTKSFIKTYPNSYVSVYELNSFKTRFNIADVTELFRNLSPVLQKSEYGVQVQNLITEIEENSTGKLAKQIVATDIDGKKLSLSDFKGKYIILDFWGSWCGPCRESTPHLKELFAKYNKQGLDVLAIAVDDKPADWRKAVEKDGTSIWHNIFETKTADGRNEITTKYAVKAFPTKILIDKNGVIVGRYVGSVTPSLDQKLAEIFKTN